MARLYTCIPFYCMTMYVLCLWLCPLLLSSLLSRAHSRAQQQHVNGVRKRPSCHSSSRGGAAARGAHSTGGADAESEPPSVSPGDTSQRQQHTVAAAGSSCFSSQQELQPHVLWLAHTSTTLQLSAHTQPLSHGQGRERSTSVSGEVHQTNRTSFS